MLIPCNNEEKKQEEVIEPSPVPTPNPTPTPITKDYTEDIQSLKDEIKSLRDLITSTNKKESEKDGSRTNEVKTYY